MRALRILAGAGATLAALTLSVSAASACWSGCGYQTYVPPVAYMPQTTCGCGYQSYGCCAPMVYPTVPAYRVHQGPSYDIPPVTADEPVPEEYGYPYRSWGGGYRGIGYRGIYRGIGYRGIGYRGIYRGIGYRGIGYRSVSYRGVGYRGVGYRGIGHRGFR